MFNRWDFNLKMNLIGDSIELLNATQTKLHKVLKKQKAPEQNRRYWKGLDQQDYRSSENRVEILS